MKPWILVALIGAVGFLLALGLTSHAQEDRIHVFNDGGGSVVVDAWAVMENGKHLNPQRLALSHYDNGWLYPTCRDEATGTGASGVDVRVEGGAGATGTLRCGGLLTLTVGADGSLSAR